MLSPSPRSGPRPALLLALIVAGLLLAAVVSPPAYAQAPIASPTPAPAVGPANPWYSVDEEGNVAVDFYFFHSLTCPHCQAARPFIEQMAAEEPWLRLHEVEISQSQANAERFSQMAASVGEEVSGVPAYFYCGNMAVGFDTAESMGVALRESVVNCRDYLQANVAVAAPAAPAGAAAPAAGESADATRAEAAAGAAGAAGAGAAAGAEQATEAVALPGAAQAASVAPAVTLPWLGEVTAESAAGMSLPLLTVVIAGLDAFNPCAFFVLMFLLSLMVHAGSRARMLLIGATFVLISGLVYFLFMAAWLNVFLLLGELRIITLVAGLIAVVMAVINIKDFFWYKQGVSLSIPESAKPGLYQRMRRVVGAGSMPAMLASTVVLALAANSYELLCTSGFPMVYTRALTLHDLPTATFYAYLALYNLIYIVPLLVIVTVFAARFGAHKLSEREGRVLKLLSGLMMLMLGLLLVIAPAQLNNPLIAILLLVAAIVVTGAIVLVDKRRHANAPPKSPQSGPRRPQRPVHHAGK